VHAPGLVIAATGLRAEARAAERSEGVKALAGGGDETRLAALVDWAITDKARGVISFGIAGALQPGLKPGTCVIGMAVIGGGQWYPADEPWADRLHAAFPDAKRGAVIGSSKAIGDVSRKAELHEGTGALAVDMESQVVARIAQARGLPFAVLRVIADTSEQRLPPAAVNGMKPDGTPDIVAVLKSVASEPRQLPDLIRTAFATRRAMAELFRCHRLVGPGLGFVDLG
jgi:hopanoid-associated phosphorylase